MRVLLAFLLGIVGGAGALYYATTHDLVLRPREIADAVRVTKTPTPATRVPAPETSVPAKQARGVPSDPSTQETLDGADIRPPYRPRFRGNDGSSPRTSTQQATTTVDTAPLPAGATLAMPLASIRPAQLVDTFNDMRGGERRHEALDIAAPAGTPVLAVADGHIEKLFNSVPGGLTIYQFEPGGRYAYYYAHLQGYAPGLAEKQQVRRGQVIGYVGSTGNASPEAPHLHFAVFELGPEKRWWQGTAIDPYPLLTGHAPPPR